jgi:hypothetical protein
VKYRYDLPGVILAVFLAGCASATSTPAASPQDAAQAANPVPILKRTGAATQAVYGQVDIYGDRYASGTLHGEDVLVYTFASPAAERADLQRNSTPRDDQVVILGHLFDVTVEGIQAVSGAWDYPVSPSVIAARVGGSIVSG